MYMAKEGQLNLSTLFSANSATEEDWQGTRSPQRELTPLPLKTVAGPALQGCRHTLVRHEGSCKKRLEKVGGNMYTGFASRPSCKFKHVQRACSPFLQQRFTESLISAVL